MCSGAGPAGDLTVRRWLSLAAAAAAVSSGRLPHDGAARRPVGDHGRAAALSQLSDRRETVGRQ